MKRILLIGFGLSAAVLGQVAPKRLFIELRTVDYTNEIGVTRAQRNITMETTREILKRCPGLVAVTEKRETAGYVLRIYPGSSTIYVNGDVVATFAARFSVGNLAKDVCGWMSANGSSEAPSGYHTVNETR